MRLWSIHPKYLDPAGLVALWREGLLAQAVLAGATRGYTHHPQLDRFRAASPALPLIRVYLREVCHEADRRGYSFDASKVARTRSARRIEVTEDQLQFEWQHLRTKLTRRNPSWLELLGNVGTPDPHPLFTVIEGPVEAWERTTGSPRPPRRPGR